LQRRPTNVASPPWPGPVVGIIRRSGGCWRGCRPDRVTWYHIVDDYRNFVQPVGKTRHTSECLCAKVVEERSATQSLDLIVQQKADTDMVRIQMISFMLAAGIVVLTSQANAQSPDPALLAPG
jgi:hypothetical protein